jgi:hypothetical protein
MIKNLVKGHECNSCVAFKCSKITSEFPKFRVSCKFTASELAHMDCPNYMEAKPFKVPLLMHLATNPRKVGGMNEVLSKFKFRLQEKVKYPYFHLFMGEIMK